ncbi:MAG: chromosome partitioning protein, partial [Anaerolineales bacterium]
EDAIRGLEMFRSMEVPILGVIENMSYLELPDGQIMDVFGQGGGERFAANAGVPFLGAIPMNPVVREGGDQGNPIMLGHPDSNVAVAFKAILKRLMEQLETVEAAAATNIEISD